MKFFRIVPLVLLFTLMAAKSFYTYDFLMTHPSILEKEYKTCQTQLSGEASCAITNQAAQDFVKLMSERRDNPQWFGKNILKNQIILAELKEQLKSLPSNSTDIPKLKQAYNEQLFKVNSLLSVVAATSM